MNEAAIRLSGYLFDQPYASRGTGFAASLANSGAGAILLAYKIQRAGSVAEAAAAAQEAVDTAGNPVVNVEIAGGQLIVRYADETSQAYDLPDGMGGGPGEDATARASAATAQTAANDAQAEIDTHEATPHNTDITARDAAAAAQGTANNAATAATAAAATANANTGRLDAFPAGTGGVDQPARDAADGAQGTASNAATAASNAQITADAAQSDIDEHEATPHNHDTVARNAAAAAQMAAEAAAGGGPAVLYEAASVAIGGSTGLIAGNVVCPETGDLEFYFEGLTGTRRGGVAYARIPAARIRGAVSALTTAYSNDTPDVLAIAHGANRGIGVSVQATTNYMILSAQAPGNFYVRILHSLGVL